MWSQGSEEEGEEMNSKFTPAAVPDLLEACKNALADLQGIMPEFEPSGDRSHPGWRTVKELEQAIAKAEGK
jgi:2-iminoacetate synthase ThiH